MPRLNSRSFVLALGLFWAALLPLLLSGPAGAGGPGKLPNFPATKALPELPHPDTPRVLNAAYYNLRNGFRSTLMLSNQGPHPMSVQVKLFNLAGEPFALDPVTLAAGEMRGFDLRGAAPPNGFEEGSVQVLYQGVNLELGGVLNVTDQRRGLIFDQELTEPATSFVSSRLEGVWWRPTKTASLKLIVSNTTDDPLIAKAGITGISPRQKAPARIALRPHETRVETIRRAYRGSRRCHVRRPSRSVRTKGFPNVKTSDRGVPARHQCRDPFARWQFADHAEGRGTPGRRTYLSCHTRRAGGRRLSGADARAYSQGAAQRHAERHSNVGIR